MNTEASLHVEDWHNEVVKDEVPMAGAHNSPSVKPDAGMLQCGGFPSCPDMRIEFNPVTVAKNAEEI